MVLCEGGRDLAGACWFEEPGLVTNQSSIDILFFAEDGGAKPSCLLLEVKVKGLGLDNFRLPPQTLRRAQAHHQGPQPLELAAQSENLTIRPC